MKNHLAVDWCKPLQMCVCDGYFDLGARSTVAICGTHRPI